MTQELKVGSRVWFEGEKRPYNVRARNNRYIICTKPYNPQRTVLYTIMDLEEGVRGPENLIFGMGAQTDQECEEMLERLEDASKVSRRNRVQINITRTQL
jgi:hypothetical protein